MARPWDRRKGESEEAYEAFIRYRDMAEGRSIDAVGKEGGKGRGILERWSARYHWVERARIWDNHLQSERDRAAAAAVRQWERRRLDQLETAWSDAQKLREKARQLLAAPIVEMTRETDSSGNSTTTIRPIRFQIRDSASMIEVAQAIEAAVLGAALGPVAPSSAPESEGIAQRPVEPSGRAKAALKAYCEDGVEEDFPARRSMPRR
jgi:hypothetical protein